MHKLQTILVLRKGPQQADKCAASVLLLGWSFQQDDRSMLSWELGRCGGRPRSVSSGGSGHHHPTGAGVSRGLGTRTLTPRPLPDCAASSREVSWLFPLTLGMMIFQLGYDKTERAGTLLSLFDAVKFPSQPRALFLAWNEIKAFCCRVQGWLINFYLLMMHD